MRAQCGVRLVGRRGLVAALLAEATRTTHYRLLGQMVPNPTTALATRASSSQVSLGGTMGRRKPRADGAAPLH